jgi:hypothetical protein
MERDMTSPKPPMDLAFERLRLEHLAFRRAEVDEVRELEQLHLAILTHVAERPGLSSYFAEAWGCETTPAGNVAGTPASENIHVVVVMQLRVMERAFLLLRLGLYGNARENRGWMNLFRRWGRSARFHAAFELLEDTLSPELRRFYRDYIHGRDPIEKASIHHPWQRPKGERARGVFMDSGLTEAGVDGAGSSAQVRPAAGGVVDAKGQSGRDQGFENPPPSDTGGTTSGSNA